MSRFVGESNAEQIIAAADEWMGNWLGFTALNQWTSSVVWLEF